MTIDKHVAHIVLSLDLGGLERVVLGLVKEGIERHGQRISVVCLERRGRLAEQVEAMGGKVYCVDKPPGLKFSVIKKLRELFEEIRPDVVHVHQIGSLFYAGPAARRAGVPVVVHTEHGKHFGHGVRARTRMLARWAARYADRFFCVSQDIARDAQFHRIVSAKKIFVVPNGIDTAQFAAAAAQRPQVREELSIPADAPVIGTLGRLNEVKRQDVLIKAFAQVKKQIPSARLLLVGDGPMRDELGALTRELNIAEDVHFAGYTSDPQRFLGAMDVFALTSRSEGMPLSVLESWAAGVPVVASRVGGLPEMVRDGETGMLIEAGDVAGFAGAFARILTSAEFAGSLREKAQAHVHERFDTAAMMNDYLRHYMEVLASSGKRHSAAQRAASLF
jgi:sugar transferase (PEP-CTERM/EpsH1 system associated)